MSVVVTVAAAGTVVVGTKVFAAIAMAAAAQLGLQAAKAAAQAEESDRRLSLVEEDARALVEASNQVQVTLATQAALEQAVAERCSLRFVAEDFELVVERDIRGTVSVHAHSHGMSREQVAEKAHRFLGLLRQQIAYRQVLGKLKRHGFAVAEESRQDDGTVRVTIKQRR